jgi:hypothetical protein
MQLNKASLSCNAIFGLIVLWLVIITFPSTERFKYDYLDNLVLMMMSFNCSCRNKN